MTKKEDKIFGKNADEVYRSIIYDKWDPRRYIPSEIPLWKLLVVIGATATTMALIHTVNMKVVSTVDVRLSAGHWSTVTELKSRHCSGARCNDRTDSTLDLAGTFPTPIEYPQFNPGNNQWEEYRALTILEFQELYGDRTYKWSHLGDDVSYITVTEAVKTSSDSAFRPIELGLNVFGSVRSIEVK